MSKKRETIGKGKPPRDKQFSSTNQPKNNGRPKKYVTQLVEATGYKLSQIHDAIKSMLKLNLVELKAIGESPSAPALEVLIARGINGDLKRGELKNLETLLSRGYGKPKESVELSGQIEVDLYENLTKEELKKELDKYGLPQKLFDK